MRFVLRLLAFASLAVAVIIGIGDATRSVAAGALVLTNLENTLVAFWPDLTSDLTRQLPVEFTGIINHILKAPALVLFLGVFILFYIPSLMRKKKRIL